jgi:phosphotransferase system HPr (HPr) family protein
MSSIERARELVVPEPDGLHLRLASAFVDLVSGFKSDVRVAGPGGVADGRSVLDLLTLGAEGGTQVRLEVQGEDAEDAISALAELIEKWSAEDAA